ncbi:MAG: DUF4389 domain-containing protein [Candidatus Peribacteraceae bacterium]|jgi:hypothetical protein
MSSTLHFDATYSKRISRLFFLRPLWMLIEMWVLMTWGFLVCVIRFLHFFYMIVLGRRSKALWEMQLRFLRHVSLWKAYMCAITDKRPKFIEE